MISFLNKRKFLLLFFILLNANLLRSQVLLSHSSPLTFSPGGYVNCAVFDSTNNAYVLGGSFATVNGAARNNLCFLDSATLSLLTVSPYTSSIITSIDGP